MILRDVRGSLQIMYSEQLTVLKPCHHDVLPTQFSFTFVFTNDIKS